MRRLRSASREEVRVILDWAVSEGWNAGLEDAAPFYAADPEGFFVAEDNGALVAAISVVIHSDSFAFLGLYIVRPEWRGQGIGFALWRHALKHAGDRIVGLDGVPVQQAAYARSGFVRASGATRFTGRPEAVFHPDIYEAGAADVPGLVAREAGQSGVAKPRYLSAWFGNCATRKTFILGDAGFFTVRQCAEGCKIGPLWAQDSASAEAMIRHGGTVFDGPVSVDVPDGSAGLVALCAQMGMTPGFDTARMYRGAFEVPKTDFFAVTSLELG